MNEDKPKKKRRFIAVLRTLGLLFLLLFLFAVLLFKSVRFQTFVAQKVAGYLSDKTESQISIDQLSIEWFDSFALNGVLILDHHEDTLLYAQQLGVSVDYLNFTTKQIELESIDLIKGNIELVKYKGEDQLNLNQFIGKLGLTSTEKKDSSSYELLLERLSLQDSKFRYWDENKTVKEFGVDYVHLICDDLNADFRALTFKNDSLFSEVQALRLNERSGFVLKDLKGTLRLNHYELTLNEMELNSSSTVLKGKLAFLYKEYSDFKDFVNKVKIQTDFKSSQLSGKDLSYFVPVLEGLQDSIQLAGKISGKIGRLKFRDFKLAYGSKTFFEGKLNIDGLPDVENAFLYIDVENFETSEKDIKSIPLPPFKAPTHIKIPAWFKNLGAISFSGKYTGFSNDFVAYGTFKTSTGKVDTDVNFSKNESGELAISGKVNTKNFNLKRLLGQKELGYLSFSGKLNSKTKKKQFLLDMEGESSRFDFNNYSYTGIKVDGKMTPKEFNGNLSVLDTNLIMDFKGGINFSKKLQEYKFTASVQKANLHQLNLLNRDSSTRVSFDLAIDLTGNSIKDIYGSLEIQDFDWFEKGKHHHFNTTNIKSIKTLEKELLSVNSDWFVGRIEGKYDLQELYPSLVNILSRDLPSLIDWKYSKAASKGTNDFRLMFKVNDYALIHDLFTPEFDVKNASFSGAFNDNDQVFSLNFKADSVQIESTTIENVKLYGHNKEEKVSVQLTSSLIALKDSMGLKNVKVTTSSKDNLSEYQLSWNNDSEFENNGLIKGVLGIQRLDSVWTHISQFDIALENQQWTMDSLNSLVFTPNTVLFDHFKMFSNQQLLSIGGLVSTQKENHLVIDTKGFELENLSRLSLGLNTKVKGVVTGKFQIDGPSDNPIITSDVEIDEFQLNGQKFGNVFLLADYFSEEGRVALDFYIENQSKVLTGNTFKIEGDYYPAENGRLDMLCQLSNLRLNFLESYFSGVFSDFKRGKTSGDLSIKGTLALPEIYGNLRLDQLNLMIDYLNVEYAINGQNLYFDNNKIKFQDFTLRHNTYTKSEAIVNGVFEHTGFKDLKYSFESVRLNDLYCLNTTIDDNPSYYGTAFVNGLLQFKGNGKNNVISGTVSTVSYEDKLSSGRTTLNLPLSEVGELQVSDFIRFIDLKNKNKNTDEVENNVNVSGLTMDLSFLIHDETKAKVIFDPKVGDEIEVTGEGNINMKITPEGKFLMSGKYTISEGKYFFTLKNFIGKKLIVEKGGTIAWDGDPLNADINIQTHYQARAKLIDLISPTVSNYETLAEQYGSRNVVYAGLGLKGELMKPSIEMSVSLPNGTAQEVEFLSTHIVGEDEVNRQVFSLLLANQFLPVHSGGLAGSVNVGAGIDNGIQFLEGQLNNALGGMFNNLDLGVDYNSKSQNDSLSQDELRLLFGFQYKNFSIKTDYAVNNEAGEIQVEYRLTDELKAKAFRRRTEQTIIDNGSNVTQGAGLVFQRTFDNVGELLRRRKKKKEKSEK